MEQWYSNTSRNEIGDIFTELCVWLSTAMTEREDTIAGPGDPGASSDGEGGGVQMGSETERRDKFPSKERGHKEEEKPGEPTKKSKNRPSYIFFHDKLKTSSDH